MSVTMSERDRGDLVKMMDILYKLGVLRRSNIDDFQCVYELFDKHGVYENYN